MGTRTKTVMAGVLGVVVAVGCNSTNRPTSLTRNNKNEPMPIASGPAYPVGEGPVLGECYPSSGIPVNMMPGAMPMSPAPGMTPTPIPVSPTPGFTPGPMPQPGVFPGTGPIPSPPTITTPPSTVSPPTANPPVGPVPRTAPAPQTNPTQNRPGKPST